MGVGIQKNDIQILGGKFLRFEKLAATSLGTCQFANRLIDKDVEVRSSAYNRGINERTELCRGAQG